VCEVWGVRARTCPYAIIVALVPATAEDTMSRHRVSYTVSCPALCNTWWYFQFQFSWRLEGAPAAPPSVGAPRMDTLCAIATAAAAAQMGDGSEAPATMGVGSLPGQLFVDVVVKHNCYVVTMIQSHAHARPHVDCWTTKTNIREFCAPLVCVMK
jgi:hypothetical protein